MRILAALAFGILLVAPRPAAQSTDLDRLMERVLTRRDENWKKLQQYVLDERETFDLTGPGGARLFGFRRDLTWFMRDGVFVRSPLRVNGVGLSEAERRKAEATWIRRERRRDERRREREASDSPSVPAAAPEAPAGELPADAFASIEPGFVSYAYFLRFKFEPGHYGLVGREAIDGRNVLRVEYYPSALFREGRTRPNRKVRDRDEDVEEKMNKVSLITMWIDPKEHQIVQYTFDNIDMDFLPGRSLVRVDEMKASMKMLQPFPNVWLPGTIDMHFLVTTAMGSIEATYKVEYQDYRLAEVTTRIKP